MGFSEALKTRVRQKANMCCCRCCTRVPIDVHHIVPQEDGGSDHEDNAAPLCPACHRIYGGNRDLRRYIRECRDTLYAKVSAGFAGIVRGSEASRGNPLECLSDSLTRGQLIFDRPRITDMVHYGQWRQDINDWFEAVVMECKDIGGDGAAAFVRDGRLAHGNYRQDGDRPYGYDEWREVLAGDLRRVATVVDMARHGWMEWDWRDFRRISELMPDLLREIRVDLSAEPLRREIILLRKNVLYNGRGHVLVYYFDEHRDLRNKFEILENLGLVRDIRVNDVDRYKMTERLAEAAMLIDLPRDG